MQILTILLRMQMLRGCGPVWKNCQWIRGIDFQFSADLQNSICADLPNVDKILRIYLHPNFCGFSTNTEITVDTLPFVVHLFFISYPTRWVPPMIQPSSSQKESILYHDRSKLYDILTFLLYFTQKPPYFHHNFNFSHPQI